MNAALRTHHLEQALDTYPRLLERQWLAADEETLTQAYELGRDLLAAGVTLLELSDLHHRVLAEWAAAGPGLSHGRVQAAGRLFNEVLAGYEMLLRGYNDANHALRGMNERLEDQIEQIARALHDESGQLLAAVLIRLDQAAAALPPQLRNEIGGVRQLLDQVEFQLRRLAHELHPALLTDLGLRPALEFLADGVAARSGLVVGIEGALPQRLSHAVELCLYRCVQECLNNVARHAQASHVRIQLRSRGDALEVRVRDDGRGFAPQRLDAPARGMGLTGMRERLRGVDGELDLRSRPGAGTEVRLLIPNVFQGGRDAGASAAGR